MSSEDWLPVAELLAPHATCYLIDRRGRGSSGDSATYSLDRESDDLAAVLEAAGPQAALVGHSYGAICALEAALRWPVSHLVVYEPPLPVGGLVAGEYLHTYRRAVETGDLDAALELGLAKFVGLPPQQISAMHASLMWAHLRSLAPTWTRELEAIDGLTASAERFAALACPTLLLLGSDSAPHPLRDATSTLYRCIPDVRLAKLDGQGHMGHRLAPQLVATLISDFLVS
jgi:pimeloyl-ACP methyl ester carboxylesterase